MSELHDGCTARVDGLVSRADLNGTTVKLLHFVEDAGRWAVETPKRGSHAPERLRVKVENLAFVYAAPPEGEEEDCGVYVNANLNGRQVAVDPGALKKRFGEIVQKYNFTDGPKSDAIADFLTSGESTTVTSEGFAERFGTSVEDASSFLAWVNVGIAFKEQYMDPHQETADKMAEQRRADRMKAAGVV